MVKMTLLILTFKCPVTYMQSIVMSCIFPQYILALRMSAQQYWISFEAAAHCGELELHFSTNGLRACFCFAGNSFDTYIYYNFEC